MPTINPGLQPFDLTGYRGASGKNFFTETRVLAEAFRLNSTNQTPDYLDAVNSHLSGLGTLLGGRINELTIACHKEGKWGELVQYDNTGNRIDEIRYAPEQTELRKIFYDYGVVNLDCHASWRHEFSLQHRMALAILTNMNGEGGVACPLAMTEGLIHALRAIGTEEQKEKFLPLLTSPDSPSHFMAGQYVTERVGGSNVAANRTVATPQSDGSWRLNGEKWFCSNPGDVWVTTAKVANTNTIGLFLVSRLRQDGSLNGCRLLRKKDIIGSKGKVTVESLYEDCEATQLGRTAHGLANLIRYILRTSRLHVICGGLGHISRAIIEAESYIAQREAYGKKLAAFPSVQQTIAELKMLQASLMLISFRAFALSDAEHPLALMLVPLLKVVTTQYSAVVAKEAMILHGGNGILGDFSVLPRILNDAIINETWEGTHALLAEHAIAAARRPKVAAAWSEYLKAETASMPAETKTLVFELHEEATRLMADDFERDANRMYLCELMWRIFALCETQRALQHAPEAAAYAPLLQSFVEQGARLPFRARAA
ncbi:acyl-CoA dehydrogenase family protein [Turneriella parva]|uniref:Acyl-CoA dehydrogenase domain-containing protein n=1 Tax=Turneriella parva (strain ATCC BAA-1111 / DSM 21527 / NCTC 11395 / H) TaxID=869212 RepID=I4BAJ5_TURPD|nr:acyl-CoA dehydrogenase family protein [Turneriella parva]AFM14302.1 acyl-CoA dehydrogenase domain-containing protein [Turneriella parva DSM 21527]